ncbi:MAG: serine/threonine protein kinase [Opitutaceae bacterium]
MNESEDQAKLFEMGAWSSEEPWEAPEPLGLKINNVEILSLAGRGGSGAVYLGVQTGLDRKVAVKLLPPAVMARPNARERFLVEAKTLASLKHDNIVNIFETGETEAGAPYFVMEWVDGGDIKTQLKDGPVSLTVFKKWIYEISAGLTAAHDSGVIHRDLKPSNVLIGTNDEIKLSDFGLAHSVTRQDSENLTLSGIAMGTVDYMAPEQFLNDGQICAQTDVYALGVLSYELLTGKLPRGAFQPASTISQAPKAVDLVIAKALAPEPKDRYESPLAMQEALFAAINKKPNCLSNIWIAALSLLAIVAFIAWPARKQIPTVDFKLESPIANTPATMPTSFPPTIVEPLQTAEPTKTVTPTVNVDTPQWVPTLRLINVHRDGHLWTSTENGVQSNDQRAILKLPVQVGTNYDIRARFTRISGMYSVAFFLETTAGPLTFELDAWGIGIGGIQEVDGKDMRAHANHFTAKLQNGEKQEVLIEVRPNSLRCFWNGRKVIDETLEGKHFSIHQLWQTAIPVSLAVGSWKSPTIFHSIETRSY